DRRCRSDGGRSGERGDAVWCRRPRSLSRQGERPRPDRGRRFFRAVGHRRRSPQAHGLELARCFLIFENAAPEAYNQNLVTSDAGYPPIGDYALIGDCHAAALVARGGSIDWACLHRFDGGSVFGRLLDAKKGGCFSLSPRRLRRVTRRYLPRTNVLETTMVTD